MRYEVRWANGYWRMFDTVTYSTVSLWGTQVEVTQKVAEANKSR